MEGSRNRVSTSLSVYSQKFKQETRFLRRGGVQETGFLPVSLFVHKNLSKKPGFWESREGSRNRVSTSLSVYSQKFKQETRFLRRGDGVKSG